MWWVAVKLWLAKAWAWTKRNWRWLVLPVGVLLYGVGRLSARKTVVVVAPELVKHEAEAAKINAEAQGARDAAAAGASGQLSGIDAAHSSSVAEVTREQKASVDAVRGDLDETNDFLRGVGKDLRK